MRRRAPATIVVLCGGGPGDGESRHVEEGVDAVVVPEPQCAGPVSLAVAVRAHRYERRDDERFTYVGPVERLPELPDVLGADARARDLGAAQEQRRVSHALAVSATIVVVAVLVACLGALA